MEFAIETQGLTRHFGTARGVEDVSLAVPAASVYGFLGPNGAGKTTTIRLLLGLLRPDGGEVRLFGVPLASDRARALANVGALVEAPSLYPHLSGRRNLEITRILLDAPPARVDEVLDITGMRDAAHRRVREYSLGMKQRLAISLALVGSPRLLILDEPGNGLDPAGQQDMRRLLRDLATVHGITVFVSSHQLAEVQQVATHLGVLHEGALKFQGAMDSLRHESRIELECDAPQQAAELLRTRCQAVEVRHDGRLSIRPGSAQPSCLNALLVNAGIGVSHLSTPPPSLESFFMDMTRAPHAEVAA